MKVIFAGLLMLSGSIALTHADLDEDVEKVAKYLLRRNNPIAELKAIGSVLNTYDLLESRSALKKLSAQFYTYFHLVVLQKNLSNDKSVCIKLFKEAGGEIQENIEETKPQEQLMMLLAQGLFEELADRCNTMTETELMTYTTNRLLTITRHWLETAESSTCLDKEEKLIKPTVNFVAELLETLANPDAMDEPDKALNPGQKEATSKMSGDL